MTEATAISGTRRQYKEMADGTLRVQIDIDPQFKAQFLEMFGQIDMPVALAPLQADFERPKEPERPKGGPLAQSAGILCGNELFQKFLLEKVPQLFAESTCLSNEEETAEVLKKLCGIESRAELDHNQESATKFHQIMRQYREWNDGKK